MSITSPEMGQLKDLEQHWGRTEKEHPVEKQNGQYQPSCLLAHSLINKLSIVVGRCDLLTQKTPEGSECHQRLISIRELAKSMAEEIAEHQCRFEALNRRADGGSALLCEIDSSGRHHQASEELPELAKKGRD